MPVGEDPEWRRGPLAAGLGAILFVLAGVAARSRLAGLALLALAGAALGAGVAAQAAMIATATATLSSSHSAPRSARALRSRPSLRRSVLRAGSTVVLRSRRRPAAAVARWFRTNVSPWSALERLLGSLRFALLFGAAAATLALAFDPRYRDFPLAIAAPPAVAFALLAWATGTSAEVEERALAAVLVFATPVIMLREGFANTDALAWVALCLAFAAGVWRVPVRGRGPREHEESEQQPDSAGRGGVQHEGRGAEGEGGERPR